MSYTDRLTDKKALEFVAKFEEVFKNVPHLPQGIIDFLVVIAPWFAIIGAVLITIASILAMFGTMFLLLISPFGAFMVLLAGLIGLVNAYLLFLAFKPLQKKQLTGWLFIFWTNILGAIQTIASILSQNAGVLSVIFLILGFYLLFEIKKEYTANSAHTGK